jgi:thiol-disulfide isomerase/thioredoxin
MKKYLFLFIILIISVYQIYSQSYKIQIRLKDFPNDTIVLGHRFNASFVPKDTTVLDPQGNGIFSGKEPLPQGMYLIYLPNKSFFDLLISDDQDFFVENDTLDFVNHIVIKGSEENIAFYDYQQYLQRQSQKAREIQDKMKTTTNENDSEDLKNELDQLNNEVLDHINQVIDDNQGSYFGKFIQSLQEVIVPDPPVDENGIIIDSSFQYRYYKNHYWDNFDLSDVRLLRTPFYEQKLMTYIERVVYQIPDSLIQEVDMLIEKSRTDPQLFRYMLITLFNYYAKSQIMGMDAVYIHIAEKYYIPEATWSDQEFIDKLKERIKKSKPTLIGQIAPDFQLVNLSSEHFIAAAEDDELKKNPYLGTFFNLHDIKSDYIILFFWEADCGHCKTATPELYQIYQRLKEKNVKVVAVNLLGGEEGKVKWVNFVNEHGLYDWINCWNPYDFEFKTVYDIVTTPALFVLDKEKKILAKKITPEQAEQIINALLTEK